MNLAHFVSPHELSDEAAAQLSELLNDLAVAFDGQYFAQITRYYVERRQRTVPVPSQATRTLRRRRRGRSESPAAPAIPHALRARSSTTGVGAQPIYATTTAISAASVHTCAPALRR